MVGIVISNDPNETSGRANKAAPSYSYPLNESLTNMTRLRFVEYNRFLPSDPGQEETTATVTLPLPITIPENYSIKTNQVDLGIYGNINQRNFSAIKDAWNKGINADDITKIGTSLTTDALKSRRFPGDSLVAGIAALGRDTGIGQAAESFVGITQNPHTTIMFDGVNLRGINLEWRLSARSEDESVAIKNIFDTVKLRAHPAEIGQGYALNYPDLVYIEFDGPVAQYLPKFQKAFISNINVTPDSPGGAIAIYKSGAPVTYSFQISAMELSILTRNTIADQIGGTNGNS